MFQQLYKTAIRASGPSTGTDLWSKGDVSSSAEPVSRTSLDSAAWTEASSSWEAPGYTRDSCWAGSLNQDQQETWASPNWQLRLAVNTKTSQTGPDTNVQATGRGPLHKSQLYTCQGCPAHSCLTQQPSALTAQIRKYSCFCRCWSKMNETDLRFYPTTLHWG